MQRMPEEELSLPIHMMKYLEGCHGMAQLPRLIIKIQSAKGSDKVVLNAGEGMDARVVVGHPRAVGVERGMNPRLGVPHSVGLPHLWPFDQEPQRVQT